MKFLYRLLMLIPIILVRWRRISWNISKLWVVRAVHIHGELVTTEYYMQKVLLKISYLPK